MYTLPFALLVLPLTFDLAYELPAGADAVVTVSAIGSTLATVLLGRRALLAWRLAALTCAAWFVSGVSSPGSPFAWPWPQALVLIASCALVTLRYERAVGWSVWAWTAVLLLVGGPGPGGVVWALALVGLVVVVDARRQRARAQEEAAAEREARARQEEQNLVLEERARIARDLHDVVAHHMSMVAVQAESAPYRLGGLDEKVQAELASIAQSARAALTDVRGILNVLRDGSDAARAPQPTLDGLEVLLGTARTAGGTVTLEVSGERRPLPAAVEIGAYRIVQESLANAARHAPGAAVEVRLDFGTDRLVLTVANGPADAVRGDTGRETSATRAGHGLVGMRERALLLGGELSAGPRPDGGFEVSATLPTEVAE
ncbi:MAG: sensor histidine kinase [Actinomycetales bacterium]|nr:sensor histidine kinase [Actinomycetales bacterium]